MEMMERITVGEINKYINVFYGKNREVWVRGGGPGPEYEDCSLWDFIRRIAPNHGVQVEQENEELDWQMCDMLADGAETKEGLIAFFYAAAIQATEMRERLRMVEEILCGDENEFDLDRLRDMIQADRNGRCVALPCKPGDKIYQINNFKIEEHVVDCVLVEPWGLSYEFWIEGFGKYRTSQNETVFFLRSEAEAVLEKMKERKQ